MELIIIGIASLLIAMLTFFSGFGLGTILMPVFAIFFPIELAIALTAVVHFFNNIFIVILVGKNADKQVLLRFGIPAVVAAFGGAWLLLKITDMPALFSYSINERRFEVSVVSFVVALLLIVFAFFDLHPLFKEKKFSKRLWPAGGLLSGFFGGLSGHQGALRSAFLVKSGLSKEAFIASAAVVSVMVDITRLSVYASRFAQTGMRENVSYIVCAIVCATAGSIIGKKLLKKITLKFIQVIVATLLLTVAIGLGLGFI